MKLIGEHLGQIIAALAAVAILITSVVFFKEPIGGFFGNIVEKETTIGDNIVSNMEDIDLKDFSSNDISYSNLEISDLTSISNFDDDSWVLSNAQWTTATIEDSNNVNHGTKSLKFNGKTGSYAGIYKNVTNLDLKNKVLYFEFYIEDVNALSKLQFTFYNSDSSNNVYKVYDIQDSRADWKTGWNTIIFQSNECSPLNSETDADLLSNVGRIMIAQTSTTDATSVVHWDYFGYTNSAINKGKIILTFEDGNDGVYDIAKPIMDAYGYKGVVYATKDLVGNSAFMNLDELKDLYNNGWDISTHSQVDLTSLTSSESIRTELLKNRDYLIENGFTRSAYHFAPHLGKYNDISLAEIEDLFITSRTVKFGYNTLPLIDQHQLYNIGGNNADISYLKTVLNHTEKSNSLTIINFHQIIDANTGSSTDTLKSTFEEFIDYLSTKDIDVVTLSEVFKN